LTAQLQGVLNDGITIEQAKGAIAERAHVSSAHSPDCGTSPANTDYARQHHLRLTGVATRVVTSTLPDTVIAELRRSELGTEPMPRLNPSGVGWRAVVAAL